MQQILKFEKIMYVIENLITNEISNLNENESWISYFG
jgi:hypothetical protein